MGEKIRVMIVDDHPLFREGVRRVLEAEEDIEVVGEVADGEQVLEKVTELSPDVVLMDINLPSVNGLHVTRLLKQDLPEVAVVVLTAYHNEEQVYHAILAGAAAYYPKDVTPTRLLRAIREVHAGHYVIADNVLDQRQLAEWIQKQFEQYDMSWDGAELMFMPLSPREMEILQLIARGKSNREIALELGISHQTVKNHMTSILRKLAVNDRTQAAIYALRRGWVSLQDDEEG